MLGNIKDFFSNFINDDDKNDAYSLELSYSPVPLTIALRKRQVEEELLSKYEISKEKTCDIL